MGEVVQKASGVFLWVTLVVKSLISGLRNGDGIRHLRQRLASIPADLESLYIHMISCIEPLFREEASQIFQLFRASGHKLDFPTLDRALCFSDHRQVIDLAIVSPQIVENASESMDLEIVAMKLNSRCKGLLEARDRRWNLETGQIPHLPNVAFRRLGGAVGYNKAVWIRSEHSSVHGLRYRGEDHELYVG